jgi:hypothetical protein
MEITILQSDIMPEVYKITGYTGRNAGETDKVSSTEDESNILLSYWGEAVSGLSEVITRHGYLQTDGTDKAIFAFNLPSSWNTNVLASLTRCMNQYVVNFICKRWFNLSKKDEVAYYDKLCIDLAINIKKHLAERKKPQRS